MDKCDYCKNNKATAWFQGKGVCRKCWIVIKYGDMEEYLKRMKEKELKKNKRKMIKKLKRR